MGLCTMVQFSMIPCTDRNVLLSVTGKNCSFLDLMTAVQYIKSCKILSQKIVTLLLDLRLLNLSFYNFNSLRKKIIYGNGFKNLLQISSFKRIILWKFEFSFGFHTRLTFWNRVFLKALILTDSMQKNHEFFYRGLGSVKLWVHNFNFTLCMN